MGTGSSIRSTEGVGWCWTPSAHKPLLTCLYISFQGLMADKLGSYELAFYTLGSVIIFASFLPFILLCLPPMKAEEEVKTGDVSGPESVDNAHQSGDPPENSGIGYCFITSVWFVRSTSMPQIKTHFQIFWYPSSLLFPQNGVDNPWASNFHVGDSPEVWDPVNHRMWPWGGGLGRLGICGEGGGVWVSVGGWGVLVTVWAGRLMREMGASYMKRVTWWATKNGFIPMHDGQLTERFLQPHSQGLLGGGGEGKDPSFPPLHHPKRPCSGCRAGWTSVQEMPHPHNWKCFKGAHC